MNGLIEKTFVWDLRSSPSQLWPILCDTPRLNEALDLPIYRVTETFDREGQRRRYGEMDESGMRVRWEEPPFEWVEGHWWRWRRFYDGGPLREAEGTLLLKPKGNGGTQVSYILAVEPNGTLGRLLLATGHLKASAQAVEKLSLRADSFCQAPMGDFFSNLADEKATRRKSPKIECSTQSPRDIKLLAQLGSWLSVAPLADAIDLRPRRLARALGVSEAEALRACLLGVKGGALRRCYRMVCTACRASAAKFETLSAIPPMAACHRCGSDYHRDLTGNCEALFSSDSTFRADPGGSYCESGVSIMPHILMQQNAGAMERREIDLSIDPALCVLRVMDGPVSMPFEMKRGAEIIISGNNINVKADTGGEKIILENHNPLPVTVTLERCDWKADRLTVAELLVDPSFRELSDTEILATGDSADAGIGAIVVISPLEGLLQRHIETANMRGGAVCGFDESSVMMVFPDNDNAIGFANELSVFLPDTKIGLDFGPLTAVTMNGALTYGGTVPETARAMCLSATPGRVRASTRALRTQTAPDISVGAAV